MLTEGAQEVVLVNQYLRLSCAVAAEGDHMKMLILYPRGAYTFDDRASLTKWRAPDPSSFRSATVFVTW